MGILYICATPIGNLEDVSIRLLKTLRRVDLIACEDTRHTIKLLNRYKIKQRLVSYHQHSRPEQEDYIIAELLRGKAVALVTDAGMPGISDPGVKLIQRAIDTGVKIEVVPGPSLRLCPGLQQPSPPSAYRAWKAKVSFFAVFFPPAAGSAKLLCRSWPR